MNKFDSIYDIFNKNILYKSKPLTVYLAGDSCIDLGGKLNSEEKKEILDWFKTERNSNKIHDDIYKINLPDRYFYFNIVEKENGRVQLSGLLIKKTNQVILATMLAHTKQMQRDYSWMTASDGYGT